MTSRRVAIVTGAARGIGAAIAKRLAADGCFVAVIDLESTSCEGTVRDIAAAGGSAAAFGVDISDELGVTRCVEAIATELGPPTILVNNAGITRDNLLFKMTLEDWDTVMAVHLRGSFLMTRETQTHMMAASWGRVVNISSVSALGNRGQANYSAAKAGLQGFTRTLAIELGRFGVTVNAVAPGFIDTQMTADTAARMGVDFEEIKRTASQQIPVGRVGQPEDIAAAVAFFVSDETSFISGQVLYAAGGPQV